MNVRDGVKLLPIGRVVTLEELRNTTNFAKSTVREVLTLVRNSILMPVYKKKGVQEPWKDNLRHLVGIPPENIEVAFKKVKNVN